MSNPILIEGNLLAPDVYLEFFDIDYRHLSVPNNPNNILYLTNTPTGSFTPIRWRGNDYRPFPLEIENIDNRGDGSAPNRPTIGISAQEVTGQMLITAIVSLGNLIGTTVRRWRTFFKYTDAGTEPNTIMHYPIEEWTIIRKILHTKSGIQFELANPLDRPGLKLPRKQILHDATIEQPGGFPGVSKLRLR